VVNNPKTLNDIIAAKLAVTSEEEEVWRMKANESKSVTPDMTDHPLMPIFEAAIKQAMYGKGERHGGALTPFMEQPWLHYAKLHGIGFLTGQAAKKLEEAASTKQGEAFIQEMLGAMVYTGMAILYSQELSKRKQ
jgi:hypothetical protein